MSQSSTTGSVKDGVFRFGVRHGVLKGYKKLAGGEIVTLRIPENAHAVKAACYSEEHKVRASHAEVLKIEIPVYDAKYVTENDSYVGRSMYDLRFIYKKGKTVWPRKPFDLNPTEDCASGIHFFLKRKDAENY